jgi:hypothetical protein
MNLRELSLPQLAGYVSEHLKRRGISIVVVGGSAITAWAPEIYTSSDIDFVATGGDSRKHIADALREIGFESAGRIFVHAECDYTLDFVGTSVHIDQRALSNFGNVKTQFGTLTVLKPEDAIADRVAAWVHWSDSESLAVAETCAQALKTNLSVERVDESLSAIVPADAPSALRLKRARERLAALLSANRV